MLVGHARLEAPDAVRVGDELLTAPRIFLNVGGRAVVPDFPRIGEVPYLTNTTMLALDRLPEHLVIVGGSYIGLEFAQMYRRFGAAVTVVERMPRLIGCEDPDISEAIADMLRARGHCRPNRRGVHHRRAAREGRSRRRQCLDGAPTIVGSHVLLAVGRRPNTDDLGLERAGVATDARGYITVDDTLATSVPGIWALGEGPWRVHAYGVQRLRNRRGQPARWR